jgi:transcriptional regulator with XRE-family HTH domain
MEQTAPVLDEPRALVRRIVMRPAILEATRAIGLTDADLARLNGIGKMAVSQWATRFRPIPDFRHAALIELVALFLGVVKAELEDGSEVFVDHLAYAQRARLMRDAIWHWLHLAIREAGINDDGSLRGLGVKSIELTGQMLVGLGANDAMKQAEFDVRQRLLDDAAKLAE